MKKKLLVMVGVLLFAFGGFLSFTHLTAPFEATSAVGQLSDDTAEYVASRSLMEITVWGRWAAYAGGGVCIGFAMRTPRNKNKNAQTKINEK